MIDHDEFVWRILRNLRFRRRAALHNGESRPLPPHKAGCPCSTSPHSSEELVLMGEIESNLRALLNLFDAITEEDVKGPAWTDGT